MNFASSHRFGHKSLWVRFSDRVLLTFVPKIFASEKIPPIVLASIDSVQWLRRGVFNINSYEYDLVFFPIYMFVFFKRKMIMNFDVHC